jgi:hypothetical protein
MAAEQLPDDGHDHVVGSGLGVVALLAGPAERGPNPVDEDDVAQRARRCRCTH